MIVQPPSKYNSAFFSSVPTGLNDPHQYYSSLQPYFSSITNEFPFLKIVFLPTVRPTTSYLQGLLLPKYMIKELALLPEQYGKYGLPIFAHIPEDYEVKGIVVYDACNRINWEHIPYRIRHQLNQSKDEKSHNIYKICTHKQEDINKTNCVINVLHSAYFLFREYQRYDKLKQFTLDCHPHGNTGRKNET